MRERNGQRAARTTPWLARRLDAEARERWFEPALYEALDEHLEAQSRRRLVRRAACAVAFRVRCEWLALECMRLRRAEAASQRKEARNSARWAWYSQKKGDCAMRLLWQDLRYGARGLLRSPGFTLVAVLTLALGIGANTAVFSVVNALLLRGLPYAEAERLVSVRANDYKAQDDHSYFSGPAIHDYREQNRSFELVSAFSPRWSFNLQGEGEPERVFGFFASANVMELLGVQPLRGRAFTAEDDRPGAPPVMLISYGLWQRRYGGDPGILGKPVMMDIGPVTVIGVLPPDFRWMDGVARRDEADLWAPLAHNPLMQRGRQVRVFTMVGRLLPGVSIEQARAEFSGIAAQLGQQYPETDRNIGAALYSLREEVIGKVRPLLLTLAGAVGLVLLIACANVANLLLARATARHRALAIRAAMGAGRGRLIRELLAESTLLALLGGVAGFALALWGVRVLVAMAPAALPRREEIAVDGMVLLFTLAMALATSFVFGLIPALQASRLNLNDALKEGGRGSGGAGRRRLRSALVVAEVALSLVVVAGASLLIRSFVKLQGVDPGFGVENVVSMDLSSLGADAARRNALMESIYSKVGALPGVTAAGETSRLPLAGVAGNPATALRIEKRPVPRGEEPPVDFRRASRHYFRAMGIPLLAGRMFQESDGTEAQAPLVAIINEAAAKKFFPWEDPLGLRIGAGDDDWFTIVGIVGNIRHLGLDSEPRPEMYMHTRQGPLNNPQLVVRTAGDAAAAIAGIRSAIRSVDPNIIISRVATMNDVRDASLAAPRFNTVLFGVFATLALALGLVGIYGVMAYTVTQRTHEIGIRMALGAARADVLRMVVGHGMTLAGAGVAIGLAGALAATRVVRTLLYETSPTDPLTFAVVVVLLAAVALLACIIPALRATRVDPLIALRYE
ncbi:MAG: ABC transporter permease [Candidatus Acidiferrales bacterium]